MHLECHTVGTAIAAAVALEAIGKVVLVAVRASRVGAIHPGTVHAPETGLPVHVSRTV
jgi:hypothetical protein